MSLHDRLPHRVITLDLDGTLYDPWACCDRADDHHLGTTTCRHLRRDTIKRARQSATRNDAQFVVLSWRCHHQRTLDWLAHVGIPTAAEFTLGSPDLAELSKATGIKRLGAGDQARYKSTVVDALQSLGVEVVESYDDNIDVCQAIAGLGVKSIHVKHLVTVDSVKFNAHRYGGSSDRYNPPTKTSDRLQLPLQVSSSLERMERGMRRLSAYSATQERA